MTHKKMLGIAEISSLFALTAFLTVLSLHVHRTFNKLDADLDEGHHVLLNSRLALDNINKAALDQRFYFEKQVPVVMGQVQGILGDTRTLLATANTTLEGLNANQSQLTFKTSEVLDQTTKTIATLDPVTRQAAADLAQLQLNEQHLDAFVTNPELTATVHDVHHITTSASVAMDDVQGTTHDIREDVHSITHPKPIVTVANWTLKVVHVFVGFF